MNKQIMVKQWSLCVTCHGSGRRTIKCPTCKGIGTTVQRIPLASLDRLSKLEYQEEQKDYITKQTKGVRGK